MADKIGTRKAVVVPVALSIVAWSFLIYLNIGNNAKELDAYDQSRVEAEERAVDPAPTIARARWI